MAYHPASALKRTLLAFLLSSIISVATADLGSQAAQWCDKSINVCVVVAVPGHVSLAGQTLLQSSQTSTSTSSSEGGSYTDTTSSSFSIPGLIHKSSSSASLSSSLSPVLASTTAVSSTVALASSDASVTFTPAVTSISTAAVPSSVEQEAATSRIHSKLQTVASSVQSTVQQVASTSSLAKTNKSVASSSLKGHTLQSEALTTQTSASMAKAFKSAHTTDASTSKDDSSKGAKQGSKNKAANHASASATKTLWWTQTASNPWWTQAGGPFDHSSKRTQSSQTHAAQQDKLRHSSRSPAEHFRSASQHTDMENTLSSAYIWVYYTVIMPMNIGWFSFGPDDARILVTPKSQTTGNSSIDIDFRSADLSTVNPSMIVQTISGTGGYQISSNGTLTDSTDGTSDFAVIYLRQAMLNGSFVISDSSSSTPRLRKRDDTSANAAAGLQSYGYAFGEVTPSSSTNSTVQVSHWAGQGQFLLALGQLGGASGPFDAQELLSNGQVVVGRSSWRMIVIAHAFFMILAFSILLPIGVLLVQSQYVQGKIARWQTAHWITQACTSFFAFIAFILGFVAAAGNSAVGAHQVLGCLIFALLVIQVTLGVVRKQMAKRQKENKWIAKGHWGLAYSLLLLAWINVGLGLELFGCTTGSVVAWYVITGLIWVSYLAFEIISRRKRTRQAQAEKSPQDLWRGGGVGNVAEKDPYNQWHATSGQEQSSPDRPNIAYLSNENDEDLLYRERTLKWRESDGADLGSRSYKNEGTLVGGVKHWAASARRVLSGGYTKAAPDSPSKLEEARRRRESGLVLHSERNDRSNHTTGSPLRAANRHPTSSASVQGTTKERYGLMVMNPSSNGCDSSSKEDGSDPFVDSQTSDLPRYNVQSINRTDDRVASKKWQRPRQASVLRTTQENIPVFDIVPRPLPKIPPQAGDPFIGQRVDRGDAQADHDDAMRSLSPTRPGIAGVGAGKQILARLDGRRNDPVETREYFKKANQASQGSSNRQGRPPDYGYDRRNDRLHPDRRESQISKYSTDSADDRTSMSSEIIQAYESEDPDIHNRSLRDGGDLRQMRFNALRGNRVSPFDDRETLPSDAYFSEHQGSDDLC